MFISLLTLSFISVAEDTHSHGQINLQLIQQDTMLALRMESPLANLVSFEHQPVKPEDKFQLNQAVNTLKSASWLDTGKLQCDAQRVVVNYSWQNTSHDAMTLPHHHDEHEHEHEHEHGHEHGHEHASIILEYELVCNRPELQELRVALFSVLPALNTVQAQWIVEQGQGAKVLTPSDNRIQF